MSETPNLPANIEPTHDIFKILDNRCPHCGQEFSEEGLNIAVFLCGIFFLVGKDNGFAGITCPSCLNTIYHQDSVKNIVRAKEILTGPIHLGDSEFDPQLRYFSSAEASPKNIPLIGDFHIPYLWHRINENEPHSLSKRIFDYLEDNSHLKEDYLCSCIPDEKDPAGTLCYVWWFKENEIEKLLKIENDKGIKIFPRYYHRCTLIEDVDRFCLNYGIFNKTLDDLINLAKSNIDKLEKYAMYNGIDSNELLDENQNIINLWMIETAQTEYQKRNDTAILNLPGDFLNILLADPNPWGFEGQIDRLCKGFWKTKNPFTTANLPLSLNNFGSHKFKKMTESEWLQQAKSDILPEFTKSHVQTYLMQNYAYFIREYVEIIKDKSFSYADFWSLKEKYLKELHRLLQKQAQLQSENRFYRDDAYWIVSFNDDEKRYGDLKGLSYIHHLIKNIGMKISYFELNDLFNTEPPKSEDEIAQGSDEDLSEGYEFGQKRQRLIDYEGLQKIRNAKNIIKKMMDDAESNGDREKYLRMKDEYSKVDKSTGSYFFKGGGIRSFDDPIDAKRAKDKIDRDIKYALNKIETNDEKAFNHFKKSIRKEEGTISYDPDKMIDWYTG